MSQIIINRTSYLAVSSSTSSSYASTFGTCSNHVDENNRSDKKISLLESKKDLILSNNTTIKKRASRKRVTKEDYHQIAKLHDINGDWCENDGFPRNSGTKTIWKCSIHGNFSATYNHVKHSSSWCPKCAKGKINMSRRITEEQYHQAAKEHDIKGDWNNINGFPKTTKTSTTWTCSIHGDFSAKYNDVKNGHTWCPKCSGHARITEEDYHQIAKNHDPNGDWDESKGLPKNVNTDTTWICSIHGKFTAMFRSIKNNYSWCPKCWEISRKITKEEYHQIAKIHDINGDWDETCGLPEKTTIETTWLCSIHGKFLASFNHVKNCSTWCQKCAGNARVTKEQYHQAASIHGGNWDESKDIPNNINTNTTWICLIHGKFLASFSNVKHNHSWCPKCASFRSETMCGKLFERFFEEKLGRKVKFEKIRPTWLRNPGTGCCLELDGYNEDFQIAFEYQGRQHYEYIPYFHESKESFEELRRRDELKRKLISEKNVKFIEIPYHIGDYRNEKALEKYIYDHLQEITRS